jgi:hypothetical protein
MTKFAKCAAVVALMAALIGSAEARGPGGGNGASSFAPGQMFRAHGPAFGHPGASGYAPGHLKRAHSAFAYAPGHRFKHR